MDARRICFLVLDEGPAFTLATRCRGVVVSALQSQLLESLPNEDVLREELHLFVAKRDGDSDWLVSDSPDARRLGFFASGDATETTRRFLIRANYMEPHRFVHEYFPQQPPQYSGQEAYIHVLVRVGQAEDWPRSLPAIQLSWTERFVASLYGARFALVLKRKAFKSNGNVDELSPRLLRSSKRDATLWICPERSASSKIFVPPVWRQVASQMFTWLFENSPILGRRAIVTGAPRVGKSVFLGFVLFQLFLLKERRVCVIDVPGLTFARLNRDGKVDEGVRGIDFQKELRRPETIYVFDSAASDDTKPLTPTEINARSILVQRDCFASNHTLRSREFALPLWTAKEIGIYARLFEVDRNNAMLLSHKWGGVPGRIFASDVNASLQLLQKTVADISVEETAEALFQTKMTKSWTETALSPSGRKWRSLVVVAGDARNKFESDGCVVFTSQFVCDELIQRLPERTWSLRRFETAHQRKLWNQIHTSLASSALEEEEKHETPGEIRQKNLYAKDPYARGAWQLMDQN